MDFKLRFAAFLVHYSEGEYCTVLPSPNTLPSVWTSACVPASEGMSLGVLPLQPVVNSAIATISTIQRMNDDIFFAESRFVHLVSSPMIFISSQNWHSQL